MTMAEQTPWLSAIMPTYNGEAYLDAALQSIHDQGSSELEIIAVDDGSTDSTPAILKKWSTVLPLKILLRPHVGNWVANTNFGMKQARGEYVSILHQDDLWMPERLKRLREVTKAHPTVDFFFHPSWFINDEGQRVGQWTCPLPRHGEPLLPELILPRMLIQDFIAMPAPLFRRAAAQKVGLMDERLWMTADWKFWMALIALGPSIHVPELLAGFRIHPASQTMEGAKRPGAIARQILRMLSEAFSHFEQMGIDIRRVKRISKMNIQLTTVLSAKVHGHPARLSRLILPFLLLGPVGWYIFFRDSRIVERVVARWRAGLVVRSSWRPAPGPLKASP